MLKFKYGNGETIYKILATFYGGFARGDSWKLNSGVTSIQQEDDYYLFHGSSGSIYYCHKELYGMGSYTSSIYADFQTQVSQTKDTTMELMPPETNFMEIQYEE
jgi:hypothetical protein